MFTQKDILLLTIVDDVAASIAANTVLGSYTQLNDGEACVVNESNVVQDNTTSATKLKIAVRQGSNLYFTPVIDITKVKSYKGVAAVDDAEQITYLGYNGSSGELDDTADETFIIRIVRRDTQSTFGNKEELKFGVYKSAATTTQGEIATGLVKNLVSNFKRHKDAGEQEIKFEAVNNDPAANPALSALGNPTGNLTVVEDSTLVTMTDTQDLSAGDYLRIGRAGVESLTNPVYKIASVDSATKITLASPYQGVSGTQLAADTFLIVKVDADVADFGIRFTGVARKFEVGKFKYSKVSFKVLPNESFSLAVVSQAQASNPGVGTYEQVAELEWFCQGNSGNKYRVGYPANPSIANVSQTGVYSLLSLDFVDDSVSTIAGRPESPIQLIVACDVTTVGGAPGTCVTGVATGIADVLDAAIVAAGTGTAQAGNL